jgi:hypothetical protein
MKSIGFFSISFSAIVSTTLYKFLFVSDKKSNVLFYYSCHFAAASCILTILSICDCYVSSCSNVNISIWKSLKAASWAWTFLSSYSLYLSSYSEIWFNVIFLCLLRPSLLWFYTYFIALSQASLLPGSCKKNYRRASELIVFDKFFIGCFAF